MRSVPHRGDLSVSSLWDQLLLAISFSSTGSQRWLGRTRRRSRTFPELRMRRLTPSKLKFVRGLLGPILVLATLFGIGYAAVVMLHSLPAHPSVKALSMRFVKSQNSTISDWNMTLIDNSTMTAIMGIVCQANRSSNNCNQIGPIYYTTTPFYI